RHRLRSTPQPVYRRYVADPAQCSGFWRGASVAFGRSDSRKKLRHFFEVDRHFVVLAALEALADRGDIEPKVVAEAIVKFGIDPAKRNPLDC
ncbi:hypothetical protein ACQKP6_29885, partial [Pseudomonas fluorescens]|uniref:hypothetical protein n=1 Tax=Pseudomonas fluorescens TaxID=294 RepID=UPI003D038834